MLPVAAGGSKPTKVMVVPSQQRLETGQLSNQTRREDSTVDALTKKGWLGMWLSQRAKPESPSKGLREWLTSHSFPAPQRRKEKDLANKWPQRPSREHQGRHFYACKAGFEHKCGHICNPSRQSLFPWWLKNQPFKLTCFFPSYRILSFQRYLYFFRGVCTCHNTRWKSEDTLGKRVSPFTMWVMRIRPGSQAQW